jgi:heat shock protein HtpX
MDSKLYGAGNVAKTTLLLAGIGGLLVAIGYLLGGAGGAAIGLLFGVAISGASYWKSDVLAVKAAGAVPVSEAEAPDLHEAVGEIARRAGIPKPRVYLVDSPQPNAFATGRNPEHAVVAVTTGLIAMCDRDELMGVIAHEVGHIRHRDILIGSVAAAAATAISFAANMAMWAGMFGGGDDDDGPSPVAVIAIALTAPIAAGLLQMALSRSREFEADRAGAELMGDPEPLARALLKLDATAARTPADVMPSQASAYIVNPLRGRPEGRPAPAGRGAPLSQANRAGGATKWFTTHPPIEERVARLRALRVEPVR